MLVNVGMELSMSTLVIGSLYKNPNAEFELSAYESSWYGKKLLQYTFFYRNHNCDEAYKIWLRAPNLTQKQH